MAGVVVSTAGCLGPRKAPVLLAFFPCFRRAPSKEGFKLGNPLEKRGPDTPKASPPAALFCRLETAS